MQVVVKGKNLELPPHIKDEALGKLTKMRRLFGRLIDMEVTFSEDRNPRINDRIHCEVVAHVKGRTIRAEATAPDPLAALDAVQTKLRQQLQKLKGKRMARLRDRNGLRQATASLESPAPGDEDEARAGEV